MKKFCAIVTAVTMSIGGVVAQSNPQLPNADFEGTWSDCKPWVSSSSKPGATGKTPADWCIAQVGGYKLFVWLGATVVGEQTTGYNETGSAVKLYNSPNPIKSSQIVPGYVTLGTTWNTANTSGDNADGGSFGGINFTGRPESISFVYKRSHGTENTTEQATVVAYLWKGQFKQASVPGNIASNATTVDMIDRDRNILGIETAQGGEVTEKGTLIAKINYAITGDAAEWTELTIPFDYVSDETPEKINVIFSAGDYFSTTPGKDNTLIIDNVVLNYPATVLSTKTYVGLLNVNLAGEPAEMPNQEVFMDQLSNGKYRLRLENFGSTEDDPAGLGSIIVDVEIKDGQVTGHADGISLAGGAINATADVTGTLNGADLSLTIDVVWVDEPNVPITVTFNGKESTPSTGVAGIVADENAPVEYYNLNGVRVNGNNLTPGVYVKRQGTKVAKVLVK